jgi:hypothetical protein
MARWNAELQGQLRGSVWNAGCTNWYKTDGGKITNNWYGPAVKYRWETRRPDLAEYALA